MTTTAKRLAPLALLTLTVLLPLAIYFQALDHPFVYDDQRVVVNNPSIGDPGNWRFVLIYEPFRPLVNLTYALDHHRAGLDPSAYHATNLFLHMLATGLFFFVVRAALTDGERREVSPFPAFAAASLFAVHPLQIEVAGYVAGRSEALAAVFVLASWLALRRWARLGAARWAVAGLSFWVFALASKEVAAVLPPLFALYDWWVLRSDGLRRRLVTFHLPLIALVALGGMVRLSSYLQNEVALPRPLWQNALTQCEVVWRYVRLVLFPRGQSLIHEVDVVATPVDPLAWAAGAALLAVVVGAFRFRHRWPVASYGVAWFLLCLAPSSVVPLHELMAEHRVYLAVAGLLIGFASLVARLDETPRAARLAGSLLVAGIIVAMSLATIQRLRVWSDPLVLWADTASRAPNTWRALAGYAAELRAAGRCDDAIPVLERIVARWPSDLDAWMDLGVCQAGLGNPREARSAFLEALQRNPSFVSAYVNLGQLAFLEGRLDEARRSLTRAIQLDPTNLQARLNLLEVERAAVGGEERIASLCGEIATLSPAAATRAGCGVSPR